MEYSDENSHNPGLITKIFTTIYFDLQIILEKKGGCWRIALSSVVMLSTCRYNCAQGKSDMVAIFTA